jgi:uncharacterized delta-60 repeat protein
MTTTGERMELEGKGDGTMRMARAHRAPSARRAAVFRRACGVVTIVALASIVGAIPAGALDGDLDVSFGTGGRVTALFPDGSFANAVAVQPDGAIVAVGAAAGPSLSGEFAVARFGTDGSLDPGFDADGMVTTPIGGGGDEARSVAIQPNGKILVAGTDSRQRFAIIRYLSDGRLDPRFGTDGIVRSDLTPGEDIGFDVAIQRDGKVVVAGSAGGRIAVVRYRRDGRPDHAFGDGGTVLMVRGGVARALAIQPDGKIVMTGYDGRGLVVVRLLPDGGSDPSFGRAGVSSIVASPILPLALALQANGRIVVAGDDDIFRAGIARFTRHGDLDPDFSGDGMRSVRFGSGEQNFTGVAVQDDGRIIAVGHIGPHEFGDPVVPRIVLARFTHGGRLDPSWGGDGKVATRFPGGASASGLVLQPDGRPVIAGQAGEGDAWGFALARYRA